MHLRLRLVSEDDDAGMAVKDLVGPLLTLTVLLLAFVLVTANGSYGKAEVASVCYARAVRAQEWPAMADGEGSGAPSVWSTDFRWRANRSSECWSPPTTDAPTSGINASPRRPPASPAPSSGSCSPPSPSP
ncbi:hypothetical protein [Streptomyces sp. NPDC058268]|uniref:hypothetical protein n=1 Tax=Streptomyces sp. NPDC058268 TaxID=3346413 RepID=UPI0036E710C2